MILNRYSTGVPLSVLAVIVFALPAVAQSPVTPLNTLVANHGSVTAGDVTFSNFQKPKILPSPLAPLGDFNDIGVTATVNPDGTVALAFVGIDPATGLASPLVASLTTGGDQIRLVSYSIGVTNPALRLHSVDQNFGPETVITGNDEAINFLYAAEPIPNYYDGLIIDQLLNTLIRGASMPSADGTGNFSGTGGILLPGGNLAGYTMANEFGLVKGHISGKVGGGQHGAH